MLPLIPLDFVLTKSRPEFCLQSNATQPDFLVDITSAKIVLKRVKVLSTYKLKIEAKLANSDAVYPLRCFDCRPFSLDAGIQSFTFSNVFAQNSTIPDYAVVGLVRATTHSGTYGTSPYTFEPFGLEEISISFDQHRYSYETNYNAAGGASVDYATSYNGLFTIGGSKSNTGLSITKANFQRGFCLYTFAFGRDEVLNCGQWNSKIAASARLSFKFSATAANPPLIAVLYSEQNQLLKVTGKREVVRLYNI